MAMCNPVNSNEKVLLGEILPTAGQIDVLMIECVSSRKNLVHHIDMVEGILDPSLAKIGENCEPWISKSGSWCE